MNPNQNQKPQNSVLANPRNQKIEDFLLNPDKVIFQSLEEFQGAVGQLLEIFQAIDFDQLEFIEGKDGVTPVRGQDYFTPADIEAFEKFIIDKIPKVGTDIASKTQVESYIREEVGKIKVLKGDDGKSFKFSDLTDAQKKELKGKDGSPDSGDDIIKKIREKRNTNQALKIKDVRGLEKVLKQLVEAVDEIPGMKEALAGFSITVPAQNGEGGSGGTGLTTKQVQDTAAAMFAGVHTGATVTHDAVANTLTIEVTGGGGGSTLTEEQVQDYIGALLAGVGGVTVTYDDAGNALSIELTGESYTTVEKNKVANIPADTNAALALKLEISSVINSLTSTATNAPLSAAQGKVLKDSLDSLNALVTSDDTTLDTLQEIVDFISLNRADLDALTIASIAGLQAALDAAATNAANIASAIDGESEALLAETSAFPFLTPAGNLARILWSNLRSDIVDYFATATETLTNKRITQRVQSLASSASPTPNSDDNNHYQLTAQAADITAVNAPTGSPTNAQMLLLSMKATGSDRSITAWNAAYKDLQTLLPDTLPVGKWVKVLCEYSTVDTAWLVIDVITEA